MAKDVITRFKLETTGFDSKIKEAAKGLSAYSKTATQAKEGFNQFTKANVDAARALGTMATSTTNAKDRAKELVGAFNDAAKAYNSLTKEQQQSDWAKALAGSLTQLQQRIKETKAEMQGLGDGMKGGGGLFSGIGSKMEGALAVFGGNLMTKGAGMLAGLASEMYDMVQQGIELAKQGEGIRIAFERLGRGDILDGLRQATHGTVTDIELMKAAVKFNDFKLPLDELGTMLAFAQQKAKDTGQSVDYMVDSIVTGLGRKSLMILDNLGLSATEVKDRMKETGDMTKAVGAIIRDQMAKAGDYVETAADRAAQANVSLQNKMEELGRKFAPVEEASNQLWTSMKIGILDVVGWPLARLLNGLTEAGRLKNMLDDVNGGGNGKESQTEKALRMLREYSGGGRGIEGKRDLYNRQVASYSKQEEKAWREANRLREELKGLRSQQKENGLAGNIQPLISETTRQLEAAENRAKAIQIMRSTYQKGAAGILNPVATKTPAITNTPGATRTRTAATPKTEEQQNQTRIAELVKQYQDLATAAKTADDAQKAGLTERMAKIHGEIKTLQDRNTELKKFADEAQRVQFPVGSLPQLNEQLKTLQTEQAKALDAKQWKDYQQQIEQTQYQIDALKGKWQDGLQATFKLDDSDVLAKVRDIDGVTINPKTLTVTANTADAYNQVQQLLNDVDVKTVTFAVQPKKETGTSITNDAGMSAYIASLKQQLETADYGTSLYNGLSAQLADMTTLQTLVGESLKAGLGTAMFDAADATGKDFWTRAMEGGVEDTDWQTIVEKINEKLKELGIDPIAINFKTGDVKKQSKEMSKDWDKAASSILAVGSAMSQIEDPAAKVVGTVAQAIATIALGYAQATTQAAKLGPWAWIAFAATGLATMISTISAIHSSTGYAEGGMIKGNSYSGDNIGGMVDGGAGGFVGLNAGEIVLNRAQTGNLASQLQGNGFGNSRLVGRLKGRDIIISIDRELSATGKGQLATWK